MSRSITWPRGVAGATGGRSRWKTCPALTFWDGSDKVAPLSLTRPVSMSCFSRLRDNPESRRARNRSSLSPASSAPAATGGGEGSLWGVSVSGAFAMALRLDRKHASPQDHRHRHGSPDPGWRHRRHRGGGHPHEGRVPGPELRARLAGPAEGLPSDRDDDGGGPAPAQGGG